MIREGDKSFLIEARSAPDTHTNTYNLTIDRVANFIVNGRNRYRADKNQTARYSRIDSN